MRVRPVSLAVSTAAMVTALTTMACGAAMAETRIDGDARRALDVTIYGDGRAFIEESRRADVSVGVQRLTIADVPRRMLIDSVVLDAGPRNAVRQLTYDANLLSMPALLQRSLGREIGVVRTHPTTGEDTLEPATVLAVDSGIVLRYRDRIETDVPGRLVFAEPAADLSARPTLIADIDAAGGGASDLTLSYLTDGLSWRADYVADIDDARETLSLTGRAILSNNSGLDLRQATVGVIAGTLRRVSPTVVRGGRDVMMSARPAGAPPEAADAPFELPAATPFADLHLYRLSTPLDLVDGAETQLPLLRRTDLAMKLAYISEGRVDIDTPSLGVPQPTHPVIDIRFATERSGDRATPLPAGVVRLFARDDAGGRRPIGEDRIPSTPAGGSIRLSPAEAFDITVTRRQTDFRRLAHPDNAVESDWTIELANAKPVPVAVTVVERIAGEWSVIESSAPVERETAGRAAWTVDVPAAGESRLTYRLRVQLPKPITQEGRPTPH